MLLTRDMLELSAKSATQSRTRRVRRPALSAIHASAGSNHISGCVQNAEGEMTAPTLPPTSTMGTPVSYLTLAELERNPIYQELKHLVPNESPADRDAELERILARISAMINGLCNQNLAATTDREVGQVVVSDEGNLVIHTRGTPIIDVLSVSVGPNVYNLTEITDLSHVILEPWSITIPQAVTGSWYSTGNLPLGRGWRPRSKLWAEWTYINGFPISTIADDVNAGDTTITVVDGTGIVPMSASPGLVPTLLTIEDGIHLEQVVPTAVDGNILTVPPLLYAHETGVGIHSMPGDIKQAALILMSRIHDTWALAMGAISMDGSGAQMSEGKPRFMCDPAWILNPYIRKV
jgi:hypothetical protein